MKAISASIVVLASAIVVVGGALYRDTDVHLTYQIIGGIIGIVALRSWFLSLKEK